MPIAFLTCGCMTIRKDFRYQTDFQEFLGKESDELYFVPLSDYLKDKLNYRFSYVRNLDCGNCGKPVLLTHSNYSRSRLEADGERLRADQADQTYKQVWLQSSLARTAHGRSGGELR